jgi:hypothetical protein
MSITFTSGVGACDEHVSVTQLRELAIGFIPELRADSVRSGWELGEISTQDIFDVISQLTTESASDRVTKER